MNQTGRHQMPDEERAGRDVIGLCVVMGGMASLWGLYVYFGVPGVLFGILLLAIVSVLVGAYLKRAWLWAGAPAACLLVLCLIFPTLDLQRQRYHPCQRNLRQIGLAVLNYAVMYDCFPPAYIADANGRPMHSWRVLILPGLDRDDLYQRYDFNQPWDGPNNSKLHAEVVDVYRCPNADASEPDTWTNYVAVVGPETLWPGSETVSLDDVTDGTSRTVLVVETTNSGIHWMEPRDLDFAKMSFSINPKEGRGISSNHWYGSNHRPGGALAVFADQHTTLLTNEVSPQTVRAMLTRNGGEEFEANQE